MRHRAKKGHRNKRGVRNNEDRHKENSIYNKRSYISPRFRYRGYITKYVKCAGIFRNDAGIEQIIDEKSNQTPFRILELVNQSSDAEIGYYISGQEPYLSQYTYTSEKSDGTTEKSQTFSSVEEGLSVLPTTKLRKEFVEGSSSMVKNPLDLSWKANNPGTTKEEDYPLSFKSYAENNSFLEQMTVQSGIV